MSLIEESYKKNYETQVSIIQRHTPNREMAEDIVQESYARALKYFPSYDPEKSKFNTWFNMIMFNQLREQVGSPAYKDSLHVNDDGELVEECVEVVPYEKIQENFDLISSEIDMVNSDDTRKILDLYYLKGYRSDQISGGLGFSQSKITSSCSRFKLKLMDKYDLYL